MSVAHLITKQLVTVTLTSVTDSTTGELRQELDADLCRLLPCSLDPSLSVSLPPMIVSRLQQELFCWQWPIVTDDSQSARRLANSLSFALKLLGCDEARNNIGHTLSHGKSTENSYEWKKSSVKKNTLLHYKERCNKYERFWDSSFIIITTTTITTTITTTTTTTMLLLLLLLLLIPIVTKILLFNFCLTSQFSWSYSTKINF